MLEMSLSRTVSASDLFTDKATFWFRQIRPSVTDWDSLVSILKKDFIVADFNDHVWDEIKSSKQSRKKYQVKRKTLPCPQSRDQTIMNEESNQIAYAGIGNKISRDHNIRAQDGNTKDSSGLLQKNPDEYCGALGDKNCIKFLDESNKDDQYPRNTDHYSQINVGKFENLPDSCGEVFVSTSVSRNGPCIEIENRNMVQPCSELVVENAKYTENGEKVFENDKNGVSENSCALVEDRSGNSDYGEKK